MSSNEQPQQPQQRRQGPARPGAMTMAMQAVERRPNGPKALQIGLIQGGKMFEERIIRKRETITIGSNERNHFVLTVAGLPSRFELFQLVGEDYILNFTDQMRGRVGLAGGVQELDELRRSGAARNAGSHFQVKLNDSSRGKVVIGDTTLLFQFVIPPPIQPRPQLPAAVVGGFVSGIDWSFTAFSMASFMTLFGFIIYLENADWPVEPNIATIPDRVAELIFNEPEPPEPPPEEETVTEETTETEPEQVAEAPREPTESHQTETNSAEAHAQADADARLAVEEANAMVEQALIGAIGANGAFQDVLAGGMVTGNAEDVMATAEGVGVATTAEGGSLRERGGGGDIDGATRGLGSLARNEGSNEARQEGERVVERVVHGRANVGALEDESGSGTFDQQLVVRQIRQRLRAIQACYEHELRNNPTLSGRVLVRFTIQQTGTISGAEATENTTGSPTVGDCVARAIRSIRFTPGPEDGSVTYSYPFVFQPQN